jgi:hypothetical protein
VNANDARKKTAAAKKRLITAAKLKAAADAAQRAKTEAQTRRRVRSGAWRDLLKIISEKTERGDTEITKTYFDAVVAFEIERLAKSNGYTVVCSHRPGSGAWNDGYGDPQSWSLTIGWSRSRTEI